ncbi:IclR family transcriptional regulator [Streptomyces sp. NPDC053048]|uniref:IclR family transcriptional regulator n=1 Tax=Streptomyces sp. NPDC053048 TaxID=3365694 RepID=UPI0037D60B15
MYQYRARESSDQHPLYAYAPDCNDVRASAMNWADRLASHSGMSVGLAVPHPEGAQLIHHVFRPDNSPQHLMTGEIRPFGDALAQALAAPHDRRCVYTDGAGADGRPLPDSGCMAVAFPCPGPDPGAAAIGVTGPRHHLDPAGPEAGRYEALLRETADAISATL